MVSWLATKNQTFPLAGATRSQEPATQVGKDPTEQEI